MNIGELMRRVHRRHAQETAEVEFWEEGELETLSGWQPHMSLVLLRFSTS